MEKDIRLVLIKHNMILNMLQTISNFKKCAKTGLFGELSKQEEQFLNNLNKIDESIKDLCMEYHIVEEMLF